MKIAFKAVFIYFFVETKLHLSLNALAHTIWENLFNNVARTGRRNTSHAFEKTTCFLNRAKKKNRKLKDKIHNINQLCEKWAAIVLATMQWQHSHASQSLTPCISVFKCAILWTEHLSYSPLKRRHRATTWENGRSLDWEGGVVGV